MESQESWKFHACVGYTVIILCIGFPVWFKNTTVDRAPLPYEEIQSLEDPKLTLSVLLISSDAQEDHEIGPKLQSAFQSSRLLNINFRSRVRSNQENDAYISFKDISQLDQRLAELHSDVTSLILFEAPPILFKEGQILALGLKKTMLFKSGADPTNLVQSVKDVIGIDLIDNIANAIVNPSEDKNPQWTLRRPTASPSFDVLFSLMIPQPDQFKPNWDIEHGIKTYFQPMLDSISELYDVSIKSQILYLTSLNLKPIRHSDGYFTITQNDLGLAINTGSQFSSHVSSRQTLNFLTFIPSLKNSPLYIVDDQSMQSSSNAFLVPRWGGVKILNTNQTALDMKHVMSTFVTHFRNLIGLDYYDIRTTFKIKNDIITPLEKDFLIRLGCVENLAVSKMTMQSLSHLLTKISNIVINEEVSQQVYSAVKDYVDAVKNAKKGEMIRAFEQSKSSVISSEKAFFDHRLLALLYFPEDQKYAIYIPLFLPIFISYFGSIRVIYNYISKSIT